MRVLLKWRGGGVFAQNLSLKICSWRLNFGFLGGGELKIAYFKSQFVMFLFAR